MRAAKVVANPIDSYENGAVRRIMQIPATGFCAEREEKNMVVVMGSVSLAAGEIDRLMPEIAAQLEATRAEDGCELYAFARDALEPDILHISELWRDQAALAAHFAAPHMATFNTALATAKIERMLVKAYDTEGERVLIDR